MVGDYSVGFIETDLAAKHTLEGLLGHKFDASVALKQWVEKHYATKQSGRLFRSFEI